MLRSLAVALALTLSANTAQALEPLDYGVICQVILTNKREAQNTESGILNVVGPGHRFDVRSADVPAELGLSFGMRARSTSVEPRTVTITVTHPPMGPRNVRRQSWATTLAPGAETLNLFSFEKDYELVQGRWNFEIRDASGKSVSKQFRVTAPLTVPSVQNACFGGTPTS